MSLDDDFERPFELLEPPQWGALRELCRANREYFTPHQDENGLRIEGALLVLSDCMTELRPLYNEVAKIAPLYDLDESTPGNGYRSFLMLIDKCVLHCGSVCRQIYVQRDSLLFRKTHYTREIEACSQLLTSLCTCLHHLKTLHSWSEVTFDGKPSLFASDAHSPQELLNNAENINQYCFYGRCIGFQYCDDLKNFLKFVSAGMASFSETYYTNGTVIGRCTNFVKYFLDPETKARRIVNISQRSDIYFCRAFWELNESNLVMMYPAMVQSALAITQTISVPPEELNLPTVDGKSTVAITIPSSHVGKKPIHVKLLSAKRRVGMVGSARASGELYEASDVLLIHCHGGGFVAQTSKSHEVYLKEWASALDAPILTIDYSHAPEAPFPRALEEVVYAYAWALKHSTTMLGTNAKKVIFIGDSAGANLLLAAAIRCFELDIKRPDGIFLAYVPVWVEFVPSPSRLLCLADPMLPFGFMMRCLKAYAATDPTKNSSRERENEVDMGIKSDTESFAEVSESDLIALALSPNGDEANEHRLGSMASDLTLNSVSLVDADAVPGNECPKETTSQEYIRKFVDMYKNVGFGSSASSSNGLPVRESNSSNGEKPWSLFGWSRSGSDRGESRELDTDGARSPSDEFVFNVPRDPLLSPYLTPDAILRRMPPIRMVSMEADPCLDDCVMFARKLRFLGINVSLEILSGLPHGFLNLILVSKEASDGSNLCCKKIQELIDLE